MDQRQSQSFLDACAAAYAWVSCADGHLTKTEVDHFIRILARSTDMNGITEEDFERSYLDLMATFEQDFAEGEARAQARIELFSDDRERAKEIMEMANQALLADSEYNEREGVVIEQISRLLHLHSDC